MQTKFEFNISNTRVKQIRLFENLILFLNAFSFILFGVKSNSKETIISGLIILFIAFIAMLVRKEKNAINWIIAAIAFAFWLSTDYWFIGAIFLVLSYAGSINSRQKKIIVEPNQIRLIYPFTKTFTWSSLQNIVLKDGLLTLDFKNNKLLQTPIINQLNEAETKQFNDFCQERLEAKV